MTTWRPMPPEAYQRPQAKRNENAPVAVGPWRRWGAEPGEQKVYGLHIWSASELLAAEFPEPPWVVPGLLPVGLTLLAGRPKVGKSWLALQLVGAVASGGVFLGQRAERGKCLYLALEDSPRRLQGRMRLQNWASGGDADFVTVGQAGDLLPLNGPQRGAAQLAIMIRERGYRLIVIDTLSRAVRGDQNDASVMAEGLSPLQETAHANGCAVLLIDHHNKTAAATGDGGDGLPAFDATLNILGSTAKAAIADALWGLYRTPGRAGATLAIVGRDVEERQLLLRHDPVTRIWQSEGTADEVRLTESRKAILAVLKQLGPSPLTAVARALGQDKGNTHRRLQDMVSEGLVILRQMAGIPLYFLPGQELATTHTTATTPTTGTTGTTAL